jgi:hypothetical protein
MKQDRANALAVPAESRTWLEIGRVPDKTRRIIKADRELVIEDSISFTCLPRRIENLVIYTAGGQRYTCHDQIWRLKHWTPPGTWHVGYHVSP